MNESLERLTRCYEITGDGVARIRIHEAVKDPALRAAVEKLSQMDISKETLHLETKT